MDPRPPLGEPRLELREISKTYGALRANDRISLTVGAGEIHALLGENGAGKTTLMKIIHGAVTADSGAILWNREAVSIANPAAARRLGIAMVHQHFALFEQATVAENIALSQKGRLDLAGLSDRISALSERYGMKLDPGRIVGLLSVGERQRVEILRSLLENPKLLILDEPTSVLSPPAIAHLFDLLRTLAAEGCSLLYVSHKLDEIRALCHRATVLRGGKVVATLDPRRTTTADLARLMVGTAPTQLARPPAAVQGRPLLEAIGLSAPATDPFGVALESVSCAVFGGEIMGIAGVSGNGQAELTALLSGERRVAADMLWIAGEPVGALGVAERRALGLAVVPEQRLGEATVPAMTLAENLLLTGSPVAAVRHGMIDRPVLRDATQAIIDRFDVVCAGTQAAARSLSGGNLQKFIVGREISRSPRILILAQPTWGVDVAAAAKIRQSLIDLSRRGAALLVISDDLDELFDLCDRIAVLSRGRLSRPEPNPGIDRERIGALMGGSAR